MDHGSMRGRYAVRSPSLRIIGKTRSWAIIGLLTLLTICSFVDRYVMTLLLKPMHHDLAISDVQFGILVGPAFIVPYALVLFPLAWLVDHRHRLALISAGTVIWSVMTIASGWASSFGDLALLRAGLAVGEAVLAPAAISLVGDLFDKEQRRLPMVVIVLGSQVGVAAATLLGAAVLRLIAAWRADIPAWLPHADWRIVFVAVGLLPVLIGAVLAMVGREPGRAAPEQPGEQTQLRFAAHLGQYWPLYLSVALLAAFAALVGLSVTVWAPTILMRRFGASMVEVGLLFGTSVLFANVLGVLAFPLLLRHLERFREPTRAMLDIALGALAILPITMVLAYLAPNMGLAVIAFALSLFASAIAYPLPSQIVQLHTPAAFRGRIGAMLLLVLFAIASGAGPALVPKIAAGFAGRNGLANSLIIVTVLAAIIGVISWRIGRSWLSAAARAG